MFDLNRRKLLIGSLIAGAAVAGPSLAFAEDRYQVLIRLQQDVLELLARCKAPGLGYMAENDYEAKKAILNANFPYRPDGISRAEYRKLEEDTSRAFNYLSETTRAEWRAREGDAKVDTLIRYMLVEFNRTDLNDPASRVAVRALMDGKVKIDTLDADQLRMVEDAVVCIAIMKNILSFHRAPINTQPMESFHQFADKYKSLIL